MTNNIQKHISFIPKGKKLIRASVFFVLVLIVGNFLFAFLAIILLASRISHISVLIISIITTSLVIVAGYWYLYFKFTYVQMPFSSKGADKVAARRASYEFSDRSAQQTQLILGILSFLGLVLAALISSGALNKLFSSPTPSQPPTVVVVVTATTAPDVVIRPTITATVPPPEVTPTVASPVEVPTNTLEPTVEPIIVPTQIPGADWASGCISGSTWKAYPDSLNKLDQKGCIAEPVGNLFRSSDGHLNLLYNDRFEGANVYGLFTSLPQEGAVNLTINLKDFNNNFLGDIWLGIFSKPTIESDGMLVVIPAGNIDKASATTKFVFVQKEMPSRKKLQGTDYFTLSPALYKIAFDLNKASVHTKIDTAYPWAEYPTSFTEKWLFIGYETKNGTNKLQADFYNLTIQAK